MFRALYLVCISPVLLTVAVAEVAAGVVGAQGTAYALDNLGSRLIGEKPVWK